MALAAGDRRGGKTFDLILCAIALLIDVPFVDRSPTLGWVVSASFQERDEVDKTIREQIPATWYTHRKAPEHRYTFLNGPTLRNVSADDPETLKRGRVDVILYNEAQKLPVAALSNGIYGTADKGGIALLAANPPRRKIGEWVLKLKQAIDAKHIKGAKFFGFSSRDNSRIDQQARSRVGDILKLLDPRAAQSDDEGSWISIGDHAYERFNMGKNVRTTPEVGDVTAEVVKKKAHRAFGYLGGADFQGRPWNAGVIVRAFGDPKAPIYYVWDEILKEGFEDDFLDDVFFKGYLPETLMWIGDASGTWQDGNHSRGRVSFDIFKARRWRIDPPQKKISDRGEHPKNPDISDRLNLVNKLLEQGRLLVDGARCPHMVEALRECELGRTGKPRGKYAHETDALGYVLWWAEPKPEPARRTNPLEGIAFASQAMPRGPRML